MSLTLGLFLSSLVSTDNSGAGVAAAGVIAIGVIIIALGIASFVVSWGLLKGKPWAWLITVIIAIISIIMSIVSIISANFANIISLIIYGVVLYYMYRPEVRKYFGRVKIPK